MTYPLENSTAEYITEVALRVEKVMEGSTFGLSNLFTYAAILQESHYTPEVAGAALCRLLRATDCSHDKLTAIFRQMKATGSAFAAFNVLNQLNLQSGDTKNVALTLCQHPYFA